MATRVMSVRRRCEARHDGAMQPTADDRCALRPVRTAYAPAVLAAFRSAADMARQGGVQTLEQAQEHVAWLRAPQRRAVAIVDQDDLLVCLVAISVDEENRSGWFFYWLHAGHRGRGLAARAAATVAEHALTPSDEGGWGLERLELGHRVENAGSGAVARAAGFVHEGTERGKFLVDGLRRDVHVMGRLRSDPAPPTAGLPWR